MKPSSPSFDPSKGSLSSALVSVRLPNLPLHFWGLSSLCAIDNALGRFHLRSPKTESCSICTYARICVEMDFSKGFPAEIILTGDNYSWTQKMDYKKCKNRTKEKKKNNTLAQFVMHCFVFFFSNKSTRNSSTLFLPQKLHH